MSDDWDLLAEAFDKYIELKNEDDIPLWMIEERLSLQQLKQSENTNNEVKE
jgi:hypothetical protein